MLDWHDVCLLQLRVSAVDRLTASGASPTAETKNYGTLAAMFDRLLRTVPALWWLVLRKRSFDYTLHREV